jgi:hypothetical protein
MSKASTVPSTVSEYLASIGRNGGKAKVKKGFSFDRSKAVAAGKKSAEARAAKKKLLDERKRLALI